MASNISRALCAQLYYWNPLSRNPGSATVTVAQARPTMHAVHFPRGSYVACPTRLRQLLTVGIDVDGTITWVGIAGNWLSWSAWFCINGLQCSTQACAKQVLHDTSTCTMLNAKQFFKPICNSISRKNACIHTESQCTPTN